MASLRTKILTSYGISKIALLIFAAVVIADLHFLQKQIFEGQAINAFHDVTQQIRRTEKNLFLYHEESDYQQLFELLDSARLSFDAAHRALEEIAGRGEMRELENALARYREQLTRYAQPDLESRQALQQDLRDTGHTLSNLAKDLSLRERTVLASTARIAVWTLLAALATTILLGIGSAIYMVRHVVRPVRMLERQLDELAEGHEQQLTVPSRDSEIQSFVHHFNSMLSRLRAQQNQLRHHQKAAALGVLVSGVAHELNNPLSNISTSVQLLMEDGDSVDPELRAQWLSHIDEETERARRIVRRLLDSVRQPKLHIQKLPALQVLESSVALVNRHLPAHVDVHVETVTQRRMCVDRERLQQVFINLVKNAADAGAGNIWISAAESTWSESMPANTDYLEGDTTEVSQADRVMVIRIEDDGPGIAPDHLSHIFDPFFTTHSAGDGTGLGLYLVEEIVSEHYGCIAVENRARGGTRFSIWLPLALEQEVA